MPIMQVMEMMLTVRAFCLITRTFFHEDMVASSSDPTGQMGLVADVSIMVDLQSAHGEMIKGVSAKDLRRIREFNVLRADPVCLKLASGPMHPDTACPFYAGQRVKAVSSSASKPSRWLHGGGTQVVLKVLSQRWNLLLL